MPPARRSLPTSQTTCARRSIWATPVTSPRQRRTSPSTPPPSTTHERRFSEIEAGKQPTEWAPFKGKDDTLAYLNYAVGFLTLKTNPDQAIDSLLKAAQYDSDIKKTPSTYYFLAVAYESGPYKTLSTAYQTQYANKPETPESKAALEKLNVVMDRIIDAYARAIATAGTDPKTEQSRKEWMTQMSNYYKFRHEAAMWE